MQAFQHQGVTLHYAFRAPQGAAPVVVFVNSLGTDFRIWDAIVAGLPERYGVLRYDKRGHGLSDIGPTPYGMATLSTDLAALMDHLQIGRAVICGLSVGGMIAQGLWLARPDLVAALVLCDTGHKIGTAELWNARIAATQTQGLASMVDAVMERWFTPAFRRADNALYQLCRAMLVRTPAAGYAATCVALRDADFTAEVPRINVPVLTVVGAQDGATPPALVASLAALIPGARHVTIPDAGHIPCVETPEALLAVLLPFMTELGA